MHIKGINFNSLAGFHHEKPFGSHTATLTLKKLSIIVHFSLRKAIDISKYHEKVYYFGLLLAFPSYYLYL
jgi:hypothetical protein